MTERPWRPWEQAAKRRGRALKIAVVSQTRTPSDATAAASQTAQGEARHIGDLDGDFLKPYLSHHATWRDIFLREALYPWPQEYWIRKA
jgi:hypothetical protein